ncbi:glycosyltransferase family protein [Paenibacillus hexagrammi]|uniref:Glycosyltransferase family protein n=1 Tax=Paenibacillus hexagrammi TaxID=2908839 RepID=A0ABY3SI61_9BACL|nr:glycosyltransferase family protein [Paenibacillus sp. YPD9-1]UJF33200.1 glycosyltransferase family protein [Paenibacillus sp. YPD9-1]
MKTILIIQARMGSSRLPGKILFPLGETVVLDYVVSRCKQIDQLYDVIVATSTLEQDDAIAEWCAATQTTCFRGSEGDVLSRYYECAKTYIPDYVIRVTSDCPFIDHEIASELIKIMASGPSDLITLEGELPRGLWSEMVSFKALEYMYKHGQEPRHREHVTYYAYEHTDQFQTAHYRVSDSMRHPELRITLDTPEDYAMLQKISDHFTGDRLISSRRVVEYLLEHPEVIALNAHIQQKPVL